MALVAVVVLGILGWFCRAIIAWGFRELWRMVGDWVRGRMALARLEQMNQKAAPPERGETTG